MDRERKELLKISAANTYQGYTKLMFPAAPAPEADLTTQMCGVPCENPFFLSSSVVASGYDMCARALEAGWAGIVYKTYSVFVPEELSPRFDANRKEGTPFIGFRNAEQISDKPLEENLSILRRLKAEFPGKVIVGSIMGRTEEEWEYLARVSEEAGCDVIDAKVAEFKREGKLSPWYHYLSRPEFVEEEADRRAIYWAEYTGAPLYIVHLANAGGVEAVREALWKAISDGFIDTVATDHCPFMQAEKDWGKEDFTKIPNGCAGIENLYPYMLDAAGKGKITYERAVELCATNPAKIFGCTRKGAIAVGKDADLVVYDPEKDFTISVANMHSDYDHTIWEGKQLHGYPVQTWLRGKLVYDNGEYVGSYGEGKFVKRAKHL